MPKLTTGQLRAKAAVYLRAEGHSLGAIAAVLDVSKTHVVRMTTPPAPATASIVITTTIPWLDGDPANGIDPSVLERLFKGSAGGLVGGAR